MTRNIPVISTAPPAAHATMIAVSFFSFSLFSLSSSSLSSLLSSVQEIQTVRQFVNVENY